MADSDKIRIDKFLWAVRIFKTRSIASEACRKGRVLINSVQVKPSRTIDANEIITVKKLPVTYTYQVIRPIENRVSAKLVDGFIRDLTTEDEKSKILVAKTAGFGIRPRGFGRPTKKERRTIDRLSETNMDF
ncbi:MAG: S4 domain-containing protein [Bacteroidales bacterium]|jgi:ribosome-associated heat shock protein Hsp15